MIISYTAVVDTLLIIKYRAMDNTVILFIRHGYTSQYSIE